MQVRRKTPILEARQFTAESALQLISDGWLSGVEVVDGAPVGLVTRSAGRSRAVPLDGWIVLEHRAEPTFEVRDGTGMVRQEGGNAEPVRAFRPLSAEQFTEDFEVVPGRMNAEATTLTSAGDLISSLELLEKADASELADPLPGVPTMDLLETDGPSKAKRAQP